MSAVAMRLQRVVGIKPITRVVTSRAFIVWMGRLAFIGAFFGLWQLSADRWIDSFWVSSPSAVTVWIYEGFADGSLTRHIKVTMEETMYGFLYGAVGGLL